MSDLFSLLKDISDQLPGCVMASIVDQTTGMQLAAVSEGDQAAAAGADAFQSELYREATNLVPLIGAKGEVESIVLETEGKTLVAEPIGETGYFWHVATDGETTLGFTQAIMRKFRSRVLEDVTELVG